MGNRICLHFLFLSLFWNVLFVKFLNAYSGGAPNTDDTCVSLYPGHGVGSQDTVPAFKINVQSIDNRRVTVQIDGETGFRGFILQARDASDTTAIINGDFTPSISSQTLNCLHSSANTLTHTSGDIKYAVNTTWTPDSTFSGTVVFRATVVQSKPIFWTGIESPPVNILPVKSILGNTVKKATADAASATGGLTDYDTCGKTKTCFSLVVSCLESRSCNILLLGNNYGENEINFEIIGKASSGNQYFAFALSSDQEMGDDAVIECFIDDNNQVQMRESWNAGKTNSLLSSSNNLRNVQAEYNDGLIRCKWRQYLNITVKNKLFDIRKCYTLLSYGTTNNDGIKNYHTARTVSPSILDYTKFSVIASASSVDILIKFHGSLMIFVWLTFVSIATLIARHYKQVWPETMLFGKQLWFTLHRGILVIAIILAIVSQICIFVYAQGWRAETLHPYLGAIATLLMISQPIGALFRCTPGHDHRWVFNWAHWFGGNTAHILAIATIFLAFNFKILHLHPAFLWILIAFVICHCFVHITLQIHFWYTIRASKVTDSIAMTDTMKDDSVTTDNSIAFKQIILGFYVVMVSFTSLILILLIWFPAKS